MGQGLTVLHGGGTAHGAPLESSNVDSRFSFLDQTNKQAVEKQSL